MDLSKGGLAADTPRAPSKSKSTRSNSRHSRRSNSLTSEPAPPAFSEPTNSKKRKSEVVSKEGEESGHNSKKPRSKIASLEVQSNVFTRQSKIPTSSVRFSKEQEEEEEEENENERSKMPPPSQFSSRFKKQQTQTTTFQHSLSYDTGSLPLHNAFAARNDIQEQYLDNIESTAQESDILVDETQESAPEYWGTQDEFDGIGRMTQHEEEEQKLDSYDKSHHVADDAHLSPRRLSSSSPDAETDLYEDMTPQNEPLDDKNDTPEITSPDVTQHRSKSPEVSAETRDAQAINQLGSIPALFPGPNPFLQYAKALARSKGRLPDNNETTGQTTAELIEKSRKDGLELTNRLTGILEKTNNLFCRIGARQAEVRARLDEHSKKLDDEGKQIEETKRRLGEWSGQLLQEGGAEKDNA